MQQIVTTSRKRSSPRNAPSFPWPLVACVVVLVAGFAVLRALRKGEAPAGLTRPAEPDKPVAEVTVAETPDDVVEPPAETNAPARRPRRDGVIGEAVTNVVAEVAAAVPTNPPGRPPKRFGKPKGAPRVNMVEQVLFMMLSNDDTDGGMPPLPIDDNASLTNAFMAAMTNSIVIYDTDDEKTVALKERVAEAKNQLRQIYEDGGNIYDALMEYQHYVNEGAKIRSDVIREYMRLKDEASEEEAEAYLEEANKDLEKEGITIVPAKGRE